METVLPHTLIGSATGSAETIADFEAVASALRPCIFRFVLGSLRDRDAGETITQECLFAAYRSRSQFRGDASVRGWMMRIAINMMRNHLRSARLKFWRRTQRYGLDASFAADWLPDGSGSPETLALARERVERVWNAVAELPERQRTAFCCVSARIWI